MQVLIIHSTETEQELGMVTPKKSVDFPKFDDEVRRTWTDFNNDMIRDRWLADNDYEPDLEIDELTIDDFVDFHNSKSEMEIESVVSDFIQL
jgi:hypothetical protein